MELLWNFLSLYFVSLNTNDQKLTIQKYRMKNEITCTFFVCEEVSVFFLTFFVACEFIFTITFLFGTTSTWKMINDVLIWKCFLSYINNLYFFYFQQHGPNNSLARLWWFPLFKYFEKNIGGPVPRQYDWPLPWPRRFLTKHPNRDS